MSSDLQTRLTEAEKSFKKACEQIVQLNRRLDEMAKRYEKASRENHRSFRYSLRLRMAVTEGVRNMYYEYAANKADDITHLRCQVHREVGDGNQIPADGQDGDNRGEEDRGDSGGDQSNPIADLEGVGDMDNRILNDGGASDSAMQEDEEEEDDSTSDMQEDPASVDQDNESLDVDDLPSPDLETQREQIMEEVMRVSTQIVRMPTLTNISRTSTNNL